MLPKPYISTDAWASYRIRKETSQNWYTFYLQLKMQSTVSLSCADPHVRVCTCSMFYQSFGRKWRRRSSSTGLSAVDGIDRSFWLPCCSCSWLVLFSNYAFPSGVQWLSPLVMRLLPFHTSVMFCLFPFGTLHVSLTRAFKAYQSCSPYSLLWTHRTVQTGSTAFVSLVIATYRPAKVASQHVQERACFAVNAVN